MKELKMMADEFITLGFGCSAFFRRYFVTASSWLASCEFENAIKQRFLFASELKTTAAENYDSSS
jgi:hypothetical protein